MTPDRIVVIDYGSQYSRLITRRLRELNVRSLLLPATATAEAIAAESPAGILLSGGPNSVSRAGAPRLAPGLLELGIPILGICYGMQLLADELGGRVSSAEAATAPVAQTAPGGEGSTQSAAPVAAGRREYGRVRLSGYSGELFDSCTGDFDAWMSHGDTVTQLPPGFSATATTAGGVTAAMADTTRRLYGLQFHPEVTDTPQGMRVLERFIDLTGVPRTWTATNILESSIADVRRRVGDSRVLLGISGGVDSSTLGLLLHRAIGPQLVAVFVDHGLLRQGEAEEVEAALRALGVDLTVVEASERFLTALAGVTDPEAKRKAIGREFIEVFSDAARRSETDGGDIRFLAQGTLYPDVIESAGIPGAANIKSHHNVGGLPEELGFELVEPFRELFKDEVRELAEELGLPAHLRDRHPFPGPGLAVRIIGEVTRERLDILRRVDHLFVSALREFDLYHSTWQALAVLTPLRSVGVMGDQRTYGHTVALRAVSSVDGMTADWTRLPHEFLATVANRIVSAVPEVNRVVYDVTSKPPGTIEWE